MTGMIGTKMSDRVRASRWTGLSRVVASRLTSSSDAAAVLLSRGWSASWTRLTVPWPMTICTCPALLNAPFTSASAVIAP